MYFCNITGLHTYIHFTFPCAQSHPTPSPYFKMLVLSKDQEMIPPVFVVDAHAQNFVLLRCYYSSLKHSSIRTVHSLTTCYCTGLMRHSVCSSRSVCCSYQWQSHLLSAVTRTAPDTPPPPQHSASHGLWVVPVYHTTRRHIREYRALNISILTLRFHLLFKTLNNHDTTFHVRFVSPGYVALLIVVQDSLSENKMLYQRH